MTALVSLDEYGVAYRGAGGPIPALVGVTLELAPGRRLALIGESGSGKSTLALAVAGLLPGGTMESGRLAFPALGRRPAPGREVGFVFQDPGGSLNPVTPVGRQVAEAAAINRGLSRAAARAAAVDLLDRVRIPDADRRYRGYAHEFSGGQRQRIAIAAALAGEPLLLIADEPTSALDTVVQGEIVALIDDLTRTGTLALLFVTHDVALASRLSDEIAVLYAGRLVEAGPAPRVLAAPRHPYTRALIATHLDLQTPLGGRLPEIPGGLPRPGAAPPGCPYAPRCPHAMPACAVMPPWTGATADGAACWLLEP
jgi:peptide/nickel transport system ATP-binding protein